MCLYIICLSSQSNEHGRTPRFPPHVLPIHAGSTGNAIHDILDASIPLGTINSLFRVMILFFKIYIKFPYIKYLLENHLSNETTHFMYFIFIRYSPHFNCCMNRIFHRETDLSPITIFSFIV